MELGPSSKPPQISDMFQKFAIAFKAKTFEFFTEEEQDSAAVSDIEDGFTLLDSTEDFIPDQKVIIIKPDFNSQSQSQNQETIIQPFDTHFGNYLISSVFTVISSFEASYLQLQTAHVPFDKENIIVNDKLLVNQLQKLYDLRGLYIDSRKNPDVGLRVMTWWLWLRDDGGRRDVRGQYGGGRRDEAVGSWKWGRREICC